VLIGASGTDSGQGTDGGDPVGGGDFYRYQFGFGVIFFLSGDPGGDSLSGQDFGDEDHATVKPGQSASGIDQVVDLKSNNLVHSVELLVVVIYLAIPGSLKSDLPLQSILQGC
jgi:hypothetical protein